MSKIPDNCFEVHDGMRVVAKDGWGTRRGERTPGTVVFEHAIDSWRVQFDDGRQTIRSRISNDNWLVKSSWIRGDPIDILIEAVDA